MITGTVVIDVAADSEANDRRAAGYLYGIPSGARVVVNVGSRRYYSPALVEQMRQYVDSLHFDIHGSAESVEAWIRALRGEEIVRLGWPT